MVRNRRKKALYEVISRTGSKSSYDRLLRQPRPGEPGKDKPIEPEPTTLSRGVSKWPRRPRVVQFNAGRIEISMPYQVAIALLLGIILLLLVFFRLGQITYLGSEEISGADIKMPQTVQKAVPETAGGPSQTLEPASVEKLEAVRTEGNNRIVIQTYQFRAQLEPVRQYFARFGIETEIRKIDDWYYLVTSDKYENPEKRGTDGYLAKQKIIELGAKYKAPPGYETFGTKPFHDAYGMRFDD